MTHADDSSYPDKQSPTVVRVLLAVVALALAALALVYLNAVPDCRIDQQNDSFEYFSLARHLLEGEGYPSKHWMPGFPCFLAGALNLFGANWAALKLTMLAIALLGLAFSYRIFRTVITPASALSLVLVLGSTPLFFDYSHRVMSEVPALASTAFALLAMLQVKRASHRNARLLWGVALAIACILAVFIRGNALVLAPTLLAGIVVARGPNAKPVRWAYTLAIVFLVLAYALWSLRCQQRQYSGIHNVTYLQEVQARDMIALWNSSGNFGPGVERAGMRDLARRAYENVVWHQVYQVSCVFVPSADRLARVENRGVGLALVALFLVPQLVGFVRLASRSPELATFLFCSLALILIYPTGHAKRMLLPFLPLLIATGYLGLVRLLGTARADAWLVCLLIANLVSCALDADQQQRRPYSREGFEDFVKLAQTELPKSRGDDAPIGSNFDVELYAILGVPTASIPAVCESVSAGRLASALILHEGNTALDPRLESTVLAKQGRWELVRIVRKAAR